MVEGILFVVLAATSLGGAMTVVMARNPIHAAMGLLGTLFSLAVIYIINLAHLVAAVQIIVYAGAVMTLFLFVIMMIGVDKTEDLSETIPRQRLFIGILGLALLALGGALAIGDRFAWTPGTVRTEPVEGTIEILADRLFTEWLLPFESTALLLTIAAAGAIALAFFGRDGRVEK